MPSEIGLVAADAMLLDERDTRIGKRKEWHDDESDPRGRRVFKALQWRLNFFACPFKHPHHRRLLRLSLPRMSPSPSCRFHSIEKLTSAGDELFHIDPRSCRNRKRRQDAGDGGMNP